jgi:hypothetical protein
MVVVITEAMGLVYFVLGIVTGANMVLISWSWHKSSQVHKEIARDQLKREILRELRESPND